MATCPTSYLLAICACFSVATSFQKHILESHPRLRSHNGDCSAKLDPRPHVHFSPAGNWMNDPNGLVYYQGEYHLFFQTVLGSKGPGHKSWGHAVSSDLMHWKELQTAMEPDEDGDIWSGSAVVDWKNSSGLQFYAKPPLIAFYTNMPPGGGLAALHSDQRIAVSHDLGRTWMKHRKPVIEQFPDNYKRQARDPKVQWHKASDHWIMVLYVHVSHVLLYRSKNLLDWEELQDIGFQGAFECPDFFELPVAGDKDGSRYWVLMMGDASYQVGIFDGKSFTNITDVQRAEFGVRYAGTTFNEEPNGRRVQISWLKPNYNRQHPIFENTPFTGVMAVPMQLDLVRHPSGIFVRRSPVSEIAALRIRPALIDHKGWSQPKDNEYAALMQSNPSSGAGGLEVLVDVLLPPAKSIAISILAQDSSDKSAMVRLHGLQSNGTAAIAEVMWYDLRGATKAYNADKNLHWTPLDANEDQNSTAIKLVAEERRVTIRMVVDWGTLEVFDMAGSASMALYVPQFGELIAVCTPMQVELDSGDSGVELHEFKVYELESAMR